MSELDDDFCETFTAGHRKLTAREERELTERLRDDPEDHEARDTLVLAVTPLILKLVKSWRMNLSNYRDAAQFCVTQLLGQIHRYDPARGRVTTFASVSVTNAMRRWNGGGDSGPALVRVPNYMQQDHEDPDVRRAREVTSLSKARDEADRSYEIPDTREPDDSAERGEDVRRLRTAMQALPDRDRLVLEGRMAGDQLQSIAQRFGITRERIRQIELRAVTRLAEILRGEDAPCAKLVMHRVHELGGMRGDVPTPDFNRRTPPVKAWDRYLHARVEQDIIHKAG